MQGQKFGTARVSSTNGQHTELLKNLNFKKASFNHFVSEEVHLDSE